MGFKQREKRMPGTGLSILMICLVMAFLLIGVIVLEYDMHIVLLVTMAIVCLTSVWLGYSFDELIGFMKKPLAESVPTLILFLFIGIIIASWIFSGTVPALIYYGLKYINPTFFLPLGLILCSLTSLSIGTSWGTVGTLGVAMMGVGQGMGVPPAITAGMVISGAFFGDKMSPMSDTANLSTATVRGTMPKHIRAMWQTALPAFLIALVVFTAIGLSFKEGTISNEKIQIFSETLQKNFTITPLALIPIVVLFALNMANFPAIPGMAIGSLLGVIFAVVLQKAPLSEVILGLNYGFGRATGIEMVDALLLRGGIQDMMYTFSMAFISISLGGILEDVGYLKKILALIVSKIKSDRALVPVVISSTTLGTLAMGEIYFALIVSGNMFRDEFKKRHLRPEMLSRLLEEGGTMMQVFIPWSTSGIFIAGTLGLSVAQYWPYTILCYLNPLVSIAMAFMGLGILRMSNAEIKALEKGDAQCTEISAN
ncbi:MAG: Na+/H+ antiporter NhaC [Bacillota bacterium]